MDSIGHDLRQMHRTPLAPSHVATLRQAGRIVEYEAGAYLAVQGQSVDRFTYIEEGEIELVNALTGGRLISATLGPTQYMAEIPLLSGGNWAIPFRATCKTRVIEVPRLEMLRLMSEMPELSDIVITVLAARRRKHIESRESALVLIGEDVDPGVRRIAEFVNRNKIPHTSLALGSPEADAVAHGCSRSPGTSAVVFGRDAIDEPKPEKVARILGIC